MDEARNYGAPLLVALAVMLLPFAAAVAAPPVWVVTGKNNTVYLFGSVHVLQEGGFRIEGELEKAYRNAERVCLEIDIAALKPETTLSVTLERAIDPEGRGLYDLLGSSAGRVREAATTAGIDLAQFEPFEPWFAGINVSVLALQQHGYDSEHGVEQIIQAAAQRDGKASCGLETLDEQLAVLDSLPADEQAEVLLQSLDEAKGIEGEMKTLFEAWRDGNEAPLKQQLRDDFADYPELAEQLIYARNERWADQVAALLKQSEDVLVVVGALHLVGDNGLPAKLERRGFRVEKR